MGVELVNDGLIIVIQQERMKIPVADDAPSDEAVFIKKLTRSMKMAGIPMQFMNAPCEHGFRTGFWLPMEDYEQLGKPTVGDLLVFVVKLEK